MKAVLLSGAIASLLLLLGRVSGFIREAFIAAKYGASGEADSIIILLTTPDVLVNLLVGGAFSVALIPAFNRLSQLDAKYLYGEFSLLTFVFFLIVTLILIGFSDVLLYWLLPGGGGNSELLLAFQVSLLAVPFCALSGVSGAYLHFKNRFAVVAGGTLIFNFFVIFGLMTLEVKVSILVGVPLVLIVAALARWGVQVVDSRTIPFVINRQNILISSKLLKTYLYAVLSGGLLFTLPVILRSIASMEGEGNLSLLNYAIKLVDLPIGVLISIFSVAFLPRLAVSFVDEAREDYLQMINSLIFMALACTVTVCVVVFFSSREIVGMVYDWGSLTSSNLEVIEGYFSIFLMTIPFQVLNAVLVSVLASRGDTLRPLIIISIGVVSFLICALFLELNTSNLLLGSLFLFALITFSLFCILAIKHECLLFAQRKYIFEMIKLSIMLVLCSVFSFLASLVLSGVAHLIVVMLTGLVCLFLFTLKSRELRAFIGQK